ncbi:hypothetical protein BpHYR1_008533 [Brachionus plicatilis]|uniref:Uncharacterized protein n=1 Tax=Brachionus plicatilis TaxID=10195 RepID=A0A3M7T5A6_BRAPC|nr:hypothetical protein BpHYR1_008533 [Brachionus plicatilis]
MSNEKIFLILSLIYGAIVRGNLEITVRSPLENCTKFNRFVEIQPTYTYSIMRIEGFSKFNQIKLSCVTTIFKSIGLFKFIPKYQISLDNSANFVINNSFVLEYINPCLNIFDDYIQNEKNIFLYFSFTNNCKYEAITDPKIFQNSKITSLEISGLTNTMKIDTEINSIIESVEFNFYCSRLETLSKGLKFLNSLNIRSGTRSNTSQELQNFTLWTKNVNICVFANGVYCPYLSRSTLIQYYEIFIIDYFGGILKTFSNFLNLLISYERYTNLDDKALKIFKNKKNGVLFFILMIGIFINIEKPLTSENSAERLTEANSSSLRFTSGNEKACNTIVTNILSINRYFYIYLTSNTMGRRYHHKYSMIQGDQRHLIC